MAIHFWNQGTSPLGLVIRRIMPSLYPINLVTGAILPNSGGAGNATEGNKVSFLRAMTVLATSISAIAFLAFIIISLAESIIAHIGVGTSTVGATLVALGSEIPDTVSSIALARTRYYDGAMAGAIGSQVINISLGVGLPTLLAIFITGKNIKIDVTESRSLWLLTFLLLLVIIGYIIFALPLGRNFSCALSKYTYIKRPTARGLLLLLLGCTLAFIYLNEEVIEEMPEALAEHEAEEAAAKAAHY
jgi:Ca2+/Na+ antiporter